VTFARGTFARIREIDVWANVTPGKCRSGKCHSGQISLKANVFQADVTPGKCLPGRYHSGKISFRANFFRANVTPGTLFEVFIYSTRSFKLIPIHLRFFYLLLGVVLYTLISISPNFRLFSLLSIAHKQLLCKQKFEPKKLCFVRMK
jgi:hypothetical protein